MSIQVGNRIPNVTLSTMTSDGPKDLTSGDIFNSKKVLLFALPGAFTPTCSGYHLPGYIVHHDAIKAKGVDTIACLSVNDAFVMGAWGDSQNVEDKVLMLADGSASFTKAVGLELDLTAKNFGVRSQRYVMIVEGSVVTYLDIEEGSNFKVSNAETMLKLL